MLSACATLPTSRNDIADQLKKPLSRQLRPFYSDGCSKWPDGTREKPDLWLICCYNHDKAYWLGGTKEQKDQVDHTLRQCVKEHFSSAMGVIMYLGVSFGGLPDYKTDYRWGYGWTYDRGYLKVSKPELEYANNLLPKKGEPIWKYIKKKD